MRNRALAVLAALVITALAGAQNQVQITKGPTVEHTDATTAIIAWSTNVNSGTLVKYGTDPNNLTGTATMPWGGITHRVTIRNLQPGTTYYFQAVSGQAQDSGTSVASAVTQFQTKSGAAATVASPGAGSAQASPASAPQPAGAAPQPATAAPQVIAGPIPQQLTSTSATLWWETTTPTETNVRYGTQPNNLTQSAASSGKSHSHRVQLKDLRAGTTYYVALMSGGQQLAIGDFKTQPQGWLKDKTVDITNGPVIEYLSAHEAVIAWSTDQKSSTVVHYGTDPNNLNQTAEAAWGAGGAGTQNTHRVHLKNLQPNTQYWFAIQSGQAQTTNTTATSQKYPFRTVQNASAALRLAE
jgi:phosphodiesterase/alkaline phosphatase D-like protein